MLARAGRVDEHAGALDDEVDAHRAPRQLRRVARAHDLDRLAVDADRAVVDDLDLGVKLAERRVVLEQVRRLLDAAAVVDRDDVEQAVGAPLPAAQEVAADAAKAVDGDLDLLLGDDRDDGLLGRGLCGVGEVREWAAIAGERERAPRAR